MQLWKYDKESYSSYFDARIDPSKEKVCMCSSKLCVGMFRKGARGHPDVHLSSLPSDSHTGTHWPFLFQSNQFYLYLLHLPGPMLHWAVCGCVYVCVMALGLADRWRFSSVDERPGLVMTSWLRSHHSLSSTVSQKPPASSTPSRGHDGVMNDWSCGRIKKHASMLWPILASLSLLNSRRNSLFDTQAHNCTWTFTQIQG